MLDGRYEVFACKGKGVFSTVLRARDLHKQISSLTGAPAAAVAGGALAPGTEHPEVAIKVGCVFTLGIFKRVRTCSMYSYLPLWWLPSLCMGTMSAQWRGMTMTHLLTTRTRASSAGPGHNHIRCSSLDCWNPIDGNIRSGQAALNVITAWPRG